MTTGYVLIFYWTIVALGGALFIGTGAALVRYWRTGAFPGEASERHRPSTREISRAVARCGLGLVLVASGAAGLLATG